MKNNRGFISIFSLIIMFVILILVSYLVMISSLEYSILSSSNNKTQSYYQSEGKINLVLYDEEHYSEQLYLNILDVFRSNNFGTVSKKVQIKDKDLNFEDDKKNVFLKFRDLNNRINMNIIANSSVNGIETELSSSGTIVNDNFETGDSFLSLDIIDDEYKEGFKNTLENIYNNISIYNCYKSDLMYGMEFLNFSEVILSRKDKNNYELASRRDNMMEPYLEIFNEKEIFIIAKRGEEDKLQFIIGNDNNLDTIELSGLIYVEGDIIISSDFKFRGIIIIKNGKMITNNSANPRIKGLVISDNIASHDNFVDKSYITRSRHVIYKYGTYLPGFIEPDLNVIKGN